ncbi:hypothetical protein NL676_030510 [Syzygium grande]|nr:hypothetical protein NL676_030510 [Syzygium grande]
MANCSNDDGHPIEGQIDHRSDEPPGVQNFRSAREPISLLRIGNYQIRSQNASHLTAKWCYMNKQLNWEILVDRRKKKIEINWSNIAAIRLRHGSDLRIFEIELYEPPRFYSTDELRPRVRAPWNPISDFTNCQASTYRIHYLEFPHGTLERNMEPLFLLDSRLLESTGRPFPSLESPFFVGHVTGAPQAPPTSPSINSQLLQHHQIPPNHLSVPTYSSNSNLSTGPQFSKLRLPTTIIVYAQECNNTQSRHGTFRAGE